MWLTRSNVLDLDPDSQVWKWPLLCVTSCFSPPLIFYVLFLFLASACTGETTSFIPPGNCICFPGLSLFPVFYELLSQNTQGTTAHLVRSSQCNTSSKWFLNISRRYKNGKLLQLLWRTIASQQLLPTLPGCYGEKQFREIVLAESRDLVLIHRRWWWSRRWRQHSVCYVWYCG